MTKRATLLSVSLAGLLMLAAGCGLGAGGGAQVSQGVTKDAIKIGLFSPFTGGAAVYGKISHMVESIYRDLNERGGINGRKLDLVIEDDAGDPTTGTVLLKKLIERDKVFMIHGGNSSNVVIAGKPQVEQSGIPFLVQGAASGKMTDPPLRNLFHPNPTATEMAASIAQFVKSMNVRKVAVIAEKDDWGVSWYEPFMAAMKGSGAEIVADEKIDAQAGDATAQVRILMRAQPEVAVVFAYPQPMSVFLRDAYAQGLKVPVVTGNATSPEEQLQRVGQREPVLQFFRAYDFKHPANGPEYESYLKLLAKYYPKDEFDTLTLLGVSGALANIEVLKRLGDDLTWDNWIKTMEGLKDFNTPANASPVSFKPFDAKDPTTRRGGVNTRFSHLDPSVKEGSAVVTFSDWQEWLKISGQK